MRSRQSYLLLLLLLLASGTLCANDTPVLTRFGTTFDPAIPTLRSVLGYDFGEKITNYAGMAKYLETLAAAAPLRIKIEKIGESYEHRDLMYVLISSQENMSRLEDLRATNLRLTDPRRTTPKEAELITGDNPVFVCLSYTVHGDEHSSTETAMALAYYLLASRDPSTAKILENAVIMIDPLQNPDGHERFVNYFYSRAGVRPREDQNAAEHNEVWPTGRYNHYLFDLNRDWTTLSQKETRDRIIAYQRYEPEVFIDFHEMGSNSTYFFPPPGIPQNPILPKSLPLWWDILGKAVAEEFDKHRIDYYTSERFDFWYPGYGDSWPTYNGALTGTFEQGSVRGLVVRRYDGIVVHYQDAIWHHLLSSLATCRMASDNRRDKLQDFYNFFSNSLEDGRSGPVRQYFLRRSGDGLQADRLVDQLLSQGIEVKRLLAPFKAAVGSYWSETPVTVEFREGDYVIPLEQPRSKLVHILMDKEIPFDKDFLEEERKRKEERQPSEIYDITAWSLPYTGGVEAYWSGGSLRAETENVRSTPADAVTVPVADYAYLVNYSSDRDLITLFQLLQRDIRVYFSRKPFRFQSRDFNAGSFIIKRKDNPDNLQQILADVVRATGSRPVAAATGWTEQGPDIGSDQNLFLRKPKIAVLTDNPTDPTSYGAIDFLLEQRYHLDFTPINGIDLPWTKLSRYDVLVLPDAGWGSSYKSLLDGRLVSQLKTWVQNGGTLIALQSAAAFLADNGKLTDIERIRKFEKNSDRPAPPEKEEEEKQDAEPEKVRETEEPDFILGSIARAYLNRRHYLGYGYNNDELAVFLYSSNILFAPDDLDSIVTYADADHLKLSGLFWDVARRRLARKSYATAETLGKGQVVLFAEDPNFRAAWDGLSRLFLNAIVFGPNQRRD